MAYALVISLKQTLKPLLDPIRSRIQISNSKLQPIYEDLCYLKSFFDKVNSLEDSNRVEELEKDIKDVLEDTSDLIEFHLSDLVHSESESSGDGNSSSGFSQQLVKVKDKLIPLIKASKAMENDLTGQQQLPSQLPVDVAVPSTIDHQIVGLGDEVAKLQQRLLDPDSKLQLIFILGMVGIGKTTLALQVNNDPFICEKFSTRIFVEIGEEYQLKELLLRIFDKILGVVVSEVEKGQTEYELGNHLKAYLSRKNYLLILDDLRDMRACGELQPYFPDDRNGSRIVFTTRNTNVDRIANDGKYIFQKRLLNNEESWELFRKKVFSNKEMDNCPSELEEIGRTIAKSLGGLPSALVKIGEIVSNSPTTVECWTKVAQNINSVIQETAIPRDLNDDLPQHLKACFLYLGLFQPNYDVPTSQLIKLWVAEGFINPVPGQTLEETAEEYLEDLVSRGLVKVHDRSSTGRIKTCRLFHQFLQDICVFEARQKKIFHVVNGGTTSSREATRDQRRLSIQSDILHGVESAASCVRSLVFMCSQHDPVPVHVRVKCLRVVHALPIRFCRFPDEVLKQVRLRYLAITFEGELPSSISRLLNLEVLIIHRSQTINYLVFLPLEIWKLQKLRHLHCMGFDLPDPSTEEGYDLYLKNLLTLSGVSFHTCGERVLARIPDLIKLDIRFDQASHTAENIPCSAAVFSHLHRLVSFKCTITNPWEDSFSLRGFPSCLRKLNLVGCGSLWDEHSTIISRLPNLQVLKLQRRAFCGAKWELHDEVYLCLKFLVLEDLDIEELIVEANHFPVLQQLHIRHCHLLQEIPFDMAYILTLEVIEVDDCRTSLINSGLRIQECLQEELECYDLQVRIHSSFDG